VINPAGCFLEEIINLGDIKKFRLLSKKGVGENLQEWFCLSSTADHLPNLTKSAETLPEIVLTNGSLKHKPL